VDITEVDLTETGCEVVTGTGLAQNCVKWQASMLVVQNHLVLLLESYFFLITEKLQTHKNLLYITNFIRKPWKLSQYRASATGWMTRVQYPAGAMMRIFLFATTSTPALGVIQPPIQQIPGALTPEVEQLGR
jgi:hypothetical protein